MDLGYLSPPTEEMTMLELEHHGYYPLTREHLDLYVPVRPGVFMLAIRLVNGVHKTFHTSQTENLYGSLGRILSADRSHVPPVVLEHLDRFQCYFTYFVILEPEYRMEVEKMLAQTTDPVVRLKVMNCN